jgi:hypothetical protein
MKDLKSREINFRDIQEMNGIARMIKESSPESNKSLHLSNMLTYFSGSAKRAAGEEFTLEADMSWLPHYR